MLKAWRYQHDAVPEHGASKWSGFRHTGEGRRSLQLLEIQTGRSCPRRLRFTVLCVLRHSSVISVWSGSCYFQVMCFFLCPLIWPSDAAPSFFVLRQGVSECPESFGTNRGEHQLQCEICGSIDACKTGGQGQGI